MWVGLLVVWLVPWSALAGGESPVGEGASFAMIDFTARHVSRAEVAQFSRDLRETLLMDPRFDLLDELAMYEVLNGPDGDVRLSQARRLLAEAKRAYRAGDLDTARRTIEEARGLHRSLFSELARPDELADLFLYQGLVEARSGSQELARVAFIQMFLLAPDMDTRQLPPVPAPVQDLLEQARQEVRKTPLRGIRPAFAREIADRLHVNWLMTGVVERVGSGSESRATVTVDLVSPGAEEPVATLVFEIPELDAGLPGSGDPIFERIAGVTARFVQR